MAENIYEITLEEAGMRPSPVRLLVLETLQGPAGCYASHDDRHPHFHCTSCGKTFCFSNLAIPPIPLPDGFSAVSANYVVKGLCPSCSGSNGH